MNTVSLGVKSFIIAACKVPLAPPQIFKMLLGNEGAAEIDIKLVLAQKGFDEKWEVVCRFVFSDVQW